MHPEERGSVFLLGYGVLCLINCMVLYFRGSQIQVVVSRKLF